MATRTLTWARTGALAWTVTYTGTGPFEHFLEGRSRIVTDDTSVIYEDAAYSTAPPAIEVVDTATADASAGEADPPYPVLRWYGRSEAQHYSIKRYNGSSYVEVATPRQGADIRYMRWEDTAVGVPTTRQYRITAVNSAGDESEISEFSILVAGIPTRPTQAFSYAAGTGLVTVTASIA